MRLRRRGRRLEQDSRKGFDFNAFGHVRVKQEMALNDVSARDLQFQTGQWLSGKTLDTFARCGPALVINEINDPQSLDISTRINDQTMQQSNTCNMIFPIPKILAYISQLVTLEPGDIIATGTPEGVGFKRNPPIFLRDGDVVEVEIDRFVNGSIKHAKCRVQEMEAVVEMLNSIGVSAFTSHAAVQKLKEIMEKKG